MTISSRRGLTLYIAFKKYLLYFDLESTLTDNESDLSNVTDQLQVIYFNGERFFTKEYENSHVENILYDGLFYSFVVSEQAIIFTDLCHPCEWQSENVLLGGTLLADENLLNHFHYYGADERDYTIITTHHAFNGFSLAMKDYPNTDLNSILFLAFHNYFFDVMIKEYTLEELGKDIPFRFIRIENVIIIYDYDSRYRTQFMYDLCIDALPQPIEELDITEEDILEDKRQELIDGYYTLLELEEWGAFTDEGIYSRWWN